MKSSHQTISVAQVDSNPQTFWYLILNQARFNQFRHRAICTPGENQTLEKQGLSLLCISSSTTGA